MRSDTQQLTYIINAPVRLGPIVYRFALTVSCVSRLIITGKKLDVLDDPTPYNNPQSAKVHIFQSLSTIKPSRKLNSFSGLCSRRKEAHCFWAAVNQRDSWTLCGKAMRAMKAMPTLMAPSIRNKYCQPLRERCHWNTPQDIRPLIALYVQLARFSVS